ncbi:MAG: outer membrane beta-barrel protein [Candidatus Eisenbacteria bacterium]|uniref:Outer membrane beta-barrel protein n=1 Tax=Eiseniibacteriota bacterium TaxID=2212470 RepID=A0A849SPC2_UNCEI|nr:outer membrane beta-barrel protein [Candidatus Eisenbacteria bacterium]
MSRFDPRFAAHVLGVLALALFALPGIAMAQRGMSELSGLGGMPSTRPIVFGIGGGIAMPLNEAGDALDRGFNGNAYVRFQPAMLPFGFGVNVSFSKFDLSDAEVTSGVPSPGASPIGTSQMLAGLADLKFDLIKGPVRPYVLLGLGAYNLSTDLEGASTESVSETRFGVNGGAGLSIQIGPMRLWGQGRVDNMYTEEGGLVDTKSIQVVPVTFGLEF